MRTTRLVPIAAIALLMAGCSEPPATSEEPHPSEAETSAVEEPAEEEPTGEEESEGQTWDVAPSEAAPLVRGDEGPPAAEQNSAGARTADMRREAEQAAAAARAAQQQVDATAEKAAREHATTLRAELSALQQAREAAASAGMLRRRGAQRATAEVEERFIAAHGTVPEGPASETWVQATAAEAAYRIVHASGLPARVEQAMGKAARAQAEVEKAGQAEVSLANAVHTAQRDLTDLDAQDTDLGLEAMVRRAMAAEPATKENRQRHARTRQGATSPAQGQMAQPERPIEDEEPAQRPTRPLS